MVFDGLLVLIFSLLNESLSDLLCLFLESVTPDVGLLSVNILKHILSYFSPTNDLLQTLFSYNLRLLLLHLPAFFRKQRAG